MKILALGLLLTASSAFSQNLTPEQQQQLLQDVASMKARLNQLENKPAQGLKKVNFENQTTESRAQEGAPAMPSMSKEQTDQVMKELEGLKARQAENQKILDDLEKEE